MMIKVITWETVGQRQHLPGSLGIESGNGVG